jgi:amidohydrolase
MKQIIKNNFSQNIKLPTITLDLDYWTKVRQNFHRIPEIGYKEFKTKTLILEILNKLDNFHKFSKVVEIGQTGFYIDINGLSKSSNNKNYLLSLRADMDGLPFQEESELEYKSEHPNMIHGCGHDGHITVLMATIEYYLKNIEKIPENFCVRFLFQPAEEGLLGAKEMIEGGCLEGVDEIYGLHNVTTFNLGEIGVIPGTIMAKIQLFEINIKGKGGHGSTPHKCCSPITTGAQIVNGLNQIPSQSIDSKDTCVVSIGSFTSGSTFNVIPEYGKIQGTIRTVKNETGDQIIEKIKIISDSCAIMNGCSAKVDTKELGSCTINHEEPSKLIQQLAQAHFVLQTHDLPLMASEDFSYFLEKKSGCFFMLGVRDESHQEYLHTTKYDFNDKGIPHGVEMFIRIIENKSGTSLI